MRQLDGGSAREYLESVNLSIGEWNQICEIPIQSYGKPRWVKFHAPANGRAMHNFSQHISKWIPCGSWKLVQIDNSTSICADELLLISRVANGTLPLDGFIGGQTWLFEFEQGDDHDVAEEVLLSSLIFLFLLFECHVQVVSSACRDGMRLSIQDGFVYFMSNSDRDLLSAKELLRKFEANPLRSPE